MDFNEWSVTHKENDNKIDGKQIQKRDVWKDFSIWVTVKIFVLCLQDQQISNLAQNYFGSKLYRITCSKDASQLYWTGVPVVKKEEKQVSK